MHCRKSIHQIIYFICKWIKACFSFVYILFHIASIMYIQKIRQQFFKCHGTDTNSLFFVVLSTNVDIFSNNQSITPLNYSTTNTHTLTLSLLDRLHILPQIKAGKKQHYLSEHDVALDEKAYQVHFLSQFRKDYYSYYAVFHSTLWRK